VKPICGETCERAWLAAAEHLSSGSHTEYNLIVEIEKPSVHDAADHAVRKTVDDFLKSKRANPCSAVAGTIFPAAEYLNHGAKGVYELYPKEVFPNINLGPGDWGRYAYRMVRWTGGNGKTINPLEVLVDKIKAQLKGRRMRQCYEVSLTDSAIDLPLYDPALDRKRPRGGPCLSHVSFKLGEEDTLYLTALYRSHTYVARALGNFLGLASLQAFVCDETKLDPGPLVCVSTYARLEPGEGSSPWPVGAALQMVKSARKAFTKAGGVMTTAQYQKVALTTESSKEVG
jgi:thymidylate synthase